MSTQLDICEELWDDPVTLSLVIDEDGVSEVDGEHILAKVRGPAFFPEVVSGNKVLYSRDAWEKAIADSVFQRKLGDRLIFGTIGHGIKLDDDAIRNGKFSHVVTNVGIDSSGVGIAEYLVLNTPSGKILNTILRSGSKIRVSTKARGLFKETTKEGIKVINPDAFKLERIDFVIDPGYLQASPELLESLNSLNDGPEMNLDNSDGKSVEEALALLEQYQLLGTPEELTITLHENAEQIQTLTDTLESQSTSIAESLTMETEITEELKRYRKLGTVEELTKVVESSDRLVNYIYNGKVKYLSQAYSVDESLINTLIEQGTDLSVVESLLQQAGHKVNEEYALDDDGNPILDADGNPIPLDKAEEARKAAAAPAKVNEESDPLDQGNAPVDNDQGNVDEPMAPTGDKVDESKKRVPSNKFRLINEEDGTEYEVDDEGNPILDDDGNPIKKEQPAEESQKPKFKLIKEEDGTEYKVDDEGNPVLDDDGNPVPVDKVEESAKEHRGPSSSRFQNVDESKKPSAPTGGSLVQKLLTGRGRKS